MSMAETEAEDRAKQVAQRLHYVITETMEIRFPGRRVQASDFAELCQIPDTSLRNYLNGKSIPGGENLARISAATGVSIDWLLTGQGLRLREGNLLFSKPGAKGSEAEILSDIVMLPVINAEGKRPPYVATSKSWLEQHIHTEIKDLTVAQVTGDSMEPTLSNGDLVIVDSQERDLDQILEGLYLVAIEHYRKVKRLERRRQKIRVLHDNPNYGVEVYSLADFLLEVEVIGRVRGCLKHLS